MYKKIAAILGLVGVGVAGRLLPHAPNATPITAVTFAARKQLGRVWAFAIPLAAMLASDAVIGFYDWRVLLSVYGSFACIAILSQLMRKDSGVVATGALVVASSLLFFLITNGAVWATSAWYEKSFTGLVYCYTLGLPFLRNMLLGDLAYTFALLGACNALAAAQAKKHSNLFSFLGLGGYGY